MTYYISRGGQQHGPYAMADLQNMLAQGQIDPNDLAWGEGLSAWTPVSQIVTPAPFTSPAPAQPQAAGPTQWPANLGEQAPMSMAAQAPVSMGQPGDFRSANVVKRYKDAYRVAGVIVGLGKILKVIGIILAVLCLLGGVGGFAMMPSVEGASTVKIIMLVYGIMGALFTWLVFWLWGVVISAVGQLLRATLDGAVHSSPFLSDDQRAEAMGV